LALIKARKTPEIEKLKTKTINGIYLELLMNGIDAISHFFIKWISIT